MLSGRSCNEAIPVLLLRCGFGQDILIEFYHFLLLFSILFLFIYEFGHSLAGIFKQVLLGYLLSIASATGMILRIIMGVDIGIPTSVVSIRGHSSAFTVIHDD